MRRVLKFFGRELSIQSSLEPINRRKDSASGAHGIEAWVQAGVVAELGPSPSGKEGRGKKFTDLGMVGSHCASCDVQFETRPKRKTKCQECGEFNYVRKRPLDGISVLLREDEIVESERQSAWKIGQGTTFDEQLDRYANKLHDLKSSLGTAVSAVDVRLALLNEDIVVFSQQRDWISVRQTYQTIAMHCESEADYKRAAILFMVVFIYDANGARRGYSEDVLDELGRGLYPDFDSSRSWESPARVCGGIANNLEKSNISITEAEEVFMNEAAKFMNDLMPLTPEEVWSRLCAAIKS